MAKLDDFCDLFVQDDARLLIDLLKLSVSGNLNTAFKLLIQIQYYSNSNSFILFFCFMRRKTLLILKRFQS